MHFPETSIENLRGFGYTEDEARFLYLVATHSGYFSTRQYLEFTGAKSGEKNMAFTQKVLGKGHATARLLLRNGRVYHLFSRLVYRAIARENLRNRREHSVEHIRTKLAVLDFVLFFLILTGATRPTVGHKKARRHPTVDAIRAGVLPIENGNPLSGFGCIAVVGFDLQLAYAALGAVDVIRIG